MACVILKIIPVLIFNEHFYFISVHSVMANTMHFDNLVGLYTKMDSVILNKNSHTFYFILHSIKQISYIYTV